MKTNTQINIDDSTKNVNNTDIRIWTHIVGAECLSQKAMHVMRVPLSCLFLPPEHQNLKRGGEGRERRGRRGERREEEGKDRIGIRGERMTMSRRMCCGHCEECSDVTSIEPK